MTSTVQRPRVFSSLDRPPDLCYSPAMPTINRAKLLALLLEVRGAQPISFTALTSVKVPKDAPVIKKLSRVNAFLSSYENAVNRERVREGRDEELFVAKPRKWGHHISAHVIAHTTKDGALKHYLSAQILKARPPIYLVETAPFQAGKRKRLIGVPKEQIEQWLPPKVSQAEAQGIEKEIIHRDYDLSSISSASFGGKIYHLKD